MIFFQFSFWLLVADKVYARFGELWKSLIDQILFSLLITQSKRPKLIDFFFWDPIEIHRRILSVPPHIPHISHHMHSRLSVFVTVEILILTVDPLKLVIVLVVR